MIGFYILKLYISKVKPLNVKPIVGFGLEV